MTVNYSPQKKHALHTEGIYLLCFYVLTSVCNISAAHYRLDNCTPSQHIFCELHAIP